MFRLWWVTSLLPQVRDHSEFVVVSQEVHGFSWVWHSYIQRYCVNLGGGISLVLSWALGLVLPQDATKDLTGKHRQIVCCYQQLLRAAQCCPRVRSKGFPEFWRKGRLELVLPQPPCAWQEQLLQCYESSGIRVCSIAGWSLGFELVCSKLLS